MFITRTALLQRVLPNLMASLAVRLGLQSFANDAAFVADKGSPAADGDRYFSTELQRIRTFGNEQWHTVGGS